MIWLPWGAQSWQREGKVKMEFTVGRAWAVRKGAINDGFGSFSLSNQVNGQCGLLEPNPTSPELSFVPPCSLCHITPLQGSCRGPSLLVSPIVKDQV